MDGDHGGYYQFRRKLAAGYMALAILLLALLGWKIGEAERANRAADLAMTRMIAKSMAAHVAELLDATDQPLIKSAQDIGALAERDLTPAKVGALLSSAMGTADSRYWLFYVNEKGLGVAGNNGMAPSGLSFVDEPYFFALAGNSDERYFLGAPEVGRFANRRLFHLSRRVVSPTGAFRGVVVAPIDAAKVAAVFELSLLNAKMSITMAATDKKIIARAPLFEKSFALDVAQAVAEYGPFGAEGAVDAVSPISGDHRIFSYAQVGAFPMIVGVGLARDPWWRQLGGDMGAAVVGLAAMLLVAWLSGKLALLRYWQLEDIEARQRNLLREREIDQDRIEKSERRLRAITDNMPALVAYLDRDERFVFHNDKDGKLTRYPGGTAQGKTALEVYGPEIYATLEPDLRRVLAGERVSVERRYIDEGQERFFKHYYAPDFDSQGRVVGCYAMVNDITAFKQTQRRLAALSRTDALTGLPNRVELRERMEEALARCRRKGGALGCLFLDVDKFKEVNDTLGHAGGDAVLVEFSRRLKECVRQTDVVARLAGDEFVILLEGMDQPAEAEQVARKIVMAMEQDFEIHGASRRVTTSIGAVAADCATDDSDTLLSKADCALYKAKRAGRNQSSSDAS